MNSDAAKAAAMSVMSNAFNENVNPATSDMGYPDRNMDFPDTGELTAFNLNNLINNEMNNPEFQLAKVTKQDLAKYTPRYQKNLIDAQTYKSALDSGTINPNMTEFEFNKMREGLITQPGTYTKEDFA